MKELILTLGDDTASKKVEGPTFNSADRNTKQR